MTRKGLMAVVLGGAFVVASIGVYEMATEADGYARFRPVLASELRGHPEASLYFPGSTVIVSKAEDMKKFPWAFYAVPASLETTLGVDASTKDLLAWYQPRITALGYHDFGSPGQRGMGWTHGRREFFYLYYVLPDAYEYRAIAQRTEYRLVYYVGVN